VLGLLASAMGVGMRIGLAVVAGLVLAPGAWAERVVFSVSFAWGEAALDAKAEAAVAGSIGRVLACERNGVTVLGHADTSEDNVAELATERARAVKDALVAKGAANSTVGFVGRSDRQPVVPTADGVREAKNRRAEIVLVCD
jgi:OOP family OmpA-OmpF porin